MVGSLSCSTVPLSPLSALRGWHCALGSVNCSPAQLLNSLGASPTLTLTEQTGVIHWLLMSTRKRRQPAPRSKTPPSGSACPEPSRRASEGKGGGGFSPALPSPAQLPGASPRGGDSSPVARASRPSSLPDDRAIYGGECLNEFDSVRVIQRKGTRSTNEPVESSNSSLPRRFWMRSACGRWRWGWH